MPDWYYSIEGARSGPYSDDEMQRFATAGRFGAATLFWNAAFGDSWKPAADTPFRVAPPLASPPPAPAAPPPPPRGDSRSAWIAVAGCVAGLGVLLVALILFRSGPAPTQRVAQSSPPAGAFATPPIVAPPATAPPAGQSTAPTPAADAAPDVESRLPKCPSSQAASEVKHFANTLDSLKSAGLTADSLIEQQQVSATADVRSCKGTMLLSDSSRHAITYSFETRPNSQYYVRIVLSILPTCPSQNAATEVIRLANTLDSLKSTGRTAVSLSGQTEVSATETLRSCSGTLLVSDGSQHATTYSFEQRATDVFARINVQ